MEKLTIVVPMYNEEAMVIPLFDKLNEVVSQIKNYKTTILCVDDGSKDNTLSLLKNLRDKQNNIHIVSFSRNFGHEAAVAAGLNQADGDIIVVMDADLQDPPELIFEMLKLYEEGYEVVNAKRVDRKKDPLLKKVTAELFYRVIKKMSGKINVPYNVGNYRLMSRKVLKYVNELTEKNHVFRIQVPYIGFKTAEIEFARPKRFTGETHYNYKSMLRLAGDSITSSSIDPLRWSFKIGVFSGIISVLSLIVFIVLYILKIIPNNLGIILSFVSIWSSIILVCIGIVGEYVGRTLVETQNRPLYYIDEEIKAE